MTPQVNAAALQLAIGVNGLFAGTEKLHLYQSSFTPTPTSTLADFDAAKVAYSGYAGVTLAGTWSIGYDVDGNLTLLYDTEATFHQTGGSPTDIAGGWYITDAGDTVLMGNGELESPFSFNRLDNRLAVIPNYFLTFASGQSEATQVGP